MRNAFLRLTVLVAIVIFGAYACDQPTNNLDQEKSSESQVDAKVQDIKDKQGQPIEGQYIIAFKEGKAKLTAEATTRQISAMMDDYNIQSSAVSNRYEHSLKGFTAELDDSQLEKIKNDERVDYVEQNRIVILSPPEINGSNPWWCIYFPNDPQCTDNGGGGGQSTPYGINRIGGPTASSGTAWVVDTGVDLDHDDLNVDTQRSTSFVSGESTADDGNGHGTHVAGTIAALDNNIDVIGVAPGATVVGVKVLDSGGSGSTAGVIDGIDYVAANASPGDVANMSLGGGVSSALDNAVANAASNGIYFAVAAGNSSKDANNSSPARVNGANIYTISAIDNGDSFASFSNYGNPPVDYAAPGVDIKSLWKNNGTNTISGTSMASPHAAGVLLVTGGNPTTDGYANGDPDGNADPIIHN